MKIYSNSIKKIYVICMTALLISNIFKSQCYAVKNEEIKSYISNLKSEQIKKRDAAKDDLIEIKKEIVKSLINIALDTETVGHKGMKDSKRLAIDLLGNYRAIEAVEPLLSILSYEDRPLANLSYPTLGQIYPAAGAIAKIGTPATEKVLQRLSSTEIPKEIELCSWILSEIYGKDVAIFIIQRELKTAMHIQRKKNLQEALDKWLLIEE